MQIELSEPKNGWIEFRIGDFIVGGSDLEDLPINWLKSIRFSLQNRLPLCLKLNSGSFQFWILSDETTTIVENRKTEHRNFNIGKKNLIRKLIPEMKKYLDGWIFWNFNSEDLTPEQIEDRSNRLRDLIQDCEDILEG